jgi:hypothetical protein
MSVCIRPKPLFLARRPAFSATFYNEKPNFKKVCFSCACRGFPSLISGHSAAQGMGSREDSASAIERWMLAIVANWLSSFYRTSPTPVYHPGSLFAGFSRALSCFSHPFTLYLGNPLDT